MLTFILVLHVTAGSIALASMFLPLAARKGGPMHRRAGWVFVVAMTTVSVTAFALAAARALTDLTPNGRAAVAVLLFASLVTAASVSAGVRVLRAKRRSEAHRHPWDLGLAGVLVLASIGMATWGLTAGRPLLWAFSVVGFLTGGGQLIYWLRAPRHPMHWWFQHMASMLGSCIAALTAFLIVNAQRLSLDTFSVVAWLAPTIIGVPSIVIWTAYYRRLFVGPAPVERQAMVELVSTGGRTRQQAAFAAAPRPTLQGRSADGR